MRCAFHPIRYWLFAIGTLIAGHSFALDPQKTMTQFTHRHWGAADGITMPYSMAQTTDGYLWLSTTRGLYRFDGIEFKREDLTPSHNWIVENPPRLLADRDNVLWIIQGQNVMQLRNGKLITYGPKDGLPGGRINAICTAFDGTTWIGGDDGLARFVAGTWQTLGKESRLPKGSVQTVMVDRKGTLWVVVADGAQPPSHPVAFLRSGETTFQLAGDAQSDTLKLAEAPNGNIWAAQPAGSVHAFAPEQPVFHFASPNLKVGSVNILFDHEGCLWITTLGDGLRRVRDLGALGTNDLEKNSDDLDQFTEKDGLTCDMCGSIIEDREGNIWVGTTSGLDCFSENKFTSFSMREGLPFDQNLMLQATPDGSVWAGSGSRGFLKIKNGGQAFVDKSWFNLKLESVSFGVFSLYTDPAGNLLLGTGFGTLIVRQGEDQATPIFEKPRLDTVLAMTRDHDGGLWLCDFKKGVYRISESHSKELLPKSKTSGDFVMAAYTDGAGRVWLGFRSGAVACHDGTNFLWYSTKDGLAGGTVRVILSDAQNRLWVAGSGGISRFANGRFQTLTSTNGLPDDNLFTVLRDNDGFFWLAGYSGLFRVSPDELEKALSSNSGQVAGELLGIDDGLRGFVQGPLLLWGKTIAAKGTDGRLWFSTGGGLAVIDPHHIPRNHLPPPVHIEQMIAGGETNLNFEHLEFSRANRSLEIDYAGLSFVNPGKVRYKYKLVGYDDQWVDASTRHQAFYSNLRPMKYQFQVCARNNDGVWNESGDTLAFTILPAFYETKWFLTLCLALLASGLWGLHKLRLARLAARMNLELQGQKKERKRIAQELHDTLLQGFTGNAMKMEALVSQLPDSLAALKEQMRNVLIRSDRYLTEARRSVWHLRSMSLENIDVFSETLSDSSKRLLAGAQIQLNFSVEGVARKLEPVVEDNLLRICEEAITNTVKHANASTVQVKLEFGRNEVSLHIRDNGCGFDPQGPERSKSGHFGLVGIQERVESLAGKVSLSSHPGEGTEIRVSVRTS
jgi:signal transduction histidine kinase/ligand-binding sensor domain-containing protein